MSDLCYEGPESGFSINSLTATKNLKPPNLRLFHTCSQQQEDLCSHTLVLLQMSGPDVNKPPSVLLPTHDQRALVKGSPFN